MTNKTPSILNKIALLATGDEIIAGDILNTNAQEIAQRLFNHGMQIGIHMSVGDDLNEIKTAIRYLLEKYRAVIITGGLGPTSDDLTRFGLAEALNRDLVFDEPTWDWIVERLNKLGYSAPPENNRQQALFPEGAVIIPNNHGTAAGCILKDEDRFVFMLPGPPPECLPMMDKVIVPALKIAGFEQDEHHAKWLLFGVSEGKIAEELEELAQHYQCRTGYRVWYPYVEIKINSTHEEDFKQLVSLIEKNFSVYMIEDGKQSASELLKQTLSTLKNAISITDHATGGSLEAMIKTPETADKLHFGTDQGSEIHINIQGLRDYWQHNPVSHTQLELTFSKQNVIKPVKFTIPCRGGRVKLYAVEFICQKIYQYLKEISE